MAIATEISPFRLSALLRLEENPHLALELFHNAAKLRPKKFRYSARSYDVMVCKLGKARMFAEMEGILDQMSKETRFAPKEPLLCQVISYYGRARLPAAALSMFERIPSLRCRRTIRSFNCLLHAMLDSREDLERIQSLCRDIAVYELSPDACTYNVLIRAHTLYGSLEGAFELFDEMRSKGIAPTVATFGTLVSALCGASKLDEAFRLKEAMRESFLVKPNVYVYTSIISGLCKNGKLDAALKLKDEMMSDRELRLDSAVYSTLIRSLFRMGRKGEVVGMLEEMKRIGIKPDTVTYNAMIAGFCEEERDFDAAFEALNEMVRSGCTPGVVSYNTIIAGFCKAGRWRDARDLLEDMPRRECSPDVVSYRTLFNGMCDAKELRQAGTVLEEMLFKGFKPGAASVMKFVKGLSDHGEDVTSALSSLVKLNAVGLDEWKEVVSGVVKVEGLDHLTVDSLV